MKKLAIALLLLVGISVSAFGQFMVSPNIGFGNVYDIGFDKINYEKIVGGHWERGVITLTESTSLSALEVGLDLIYVAKNGFRFAFDNNFLIDGSYSYKSSIIHEDRSVTKLATYNGAVKSFYWNTQFLFGAAHWLNPNFNISWGLGLAGGLGMMSPKDKILFGFAGEINRISANIGIPIQLAVQYFFTPLIGIQVALLDTLSFNFSFFNPSIYDSILPNNNDAFFMGFANVFVINVGPVFRF